MILNNNLIGRCNIVSEKSVYKTMTVVEKEIDLEDLEKEMIIGRDILNGKGKMLVREDYVVRNNYAKEKIQSLLRRYNIDTIPVKIHMVEEKEVKSIELGTERIISDNKDNQEIRYSDVLEISDEAEAEFINRLIPEAKKNITEKMLLLFKGENKDEVATIKNDIQKSMEVINASINIPQLLEKIKKIDDSLYLYNYNTALTSYMIGKWMGLDDEKREELYITAMLVNIGVLNLPEDKRYMDQWDKANINEFYEHVIHSHRILTKCDFMTRDMLQAVLHHHEKYDGSGYPRNISGKQIPLLSRIIYIADLYAFYTIRKEYNSLRAVSTICQEHLNEVDMEIFFTLSKRLFDYFTGQKFRTRDSDPLMGKIITFDQGTGNTIYDQSNVNVYIEQENKSVIPMSLNTFSNKNIEFL